MSSAWHGPSLGRRVFLEHRTAVLVLVVLLAANVITYALVVHPLWSRVANVEERTRAAQQALAAARREQAQATALRTGKAQAAERLETFYGSVLPGDLTQARELFVPRLWQMSERLGLEPRNLSTDLVMPREEGLTRLRIGMDLVGGYADVRDFIRQIETTPEFVIIDDVRLQGGAEGATLQLRLDLSTYYAGSGR